MRIFSYRNKRLLKRTLLIALAVLLGILALIVCRFIYLGRFVTYDNAGAHLDYEQHLTATRAPEPAVSDEDFSFDTVLDAASEEDGDTAQTAKLTGYYITTTMLASGVDQVRAALSQADDYNAVMVDVKSIFGSFYYSTAISGAAKATVLDIKQVDQLIAERTEIPCSIADDTDSCVANGTGRALAWIGAMQEGTINIARRKLMKEN